MPMVLTVSNHKRPAQKLRKPYGRGGVLHPPAYVNGINHSEPQTPSLKLRKPYGRGGILASPDLHKRHQPF